MLLALLIHFMAVKLEAKQEVEPTAMSDVSLTGDDRKLSVVSRDLLPTVQGPCNVFGSCNVVVLQLRFRKMLASCLR